MINSINMIFESITKLIMLPAKAGSVWPGLIMASLFIAVLSLLCFKYFSNQEKLGRVRDRLFARTLELHIFRDDILSIFGAFGRVLSSIFIYLRETIKPILVLIIPVTLLLIHLSGWLEYRPLRKGEQVLVIAKLENSADASKIKASIANTPKIKIETEPFRSVAENSITWRISPQSEDFQTELGITIGGDEITKSIICSPFVKNISLCRVKKNLWRELLYPSEAVLKDNCPATAIRIIYPLREIRVGLYAINWIVAIFVMSIIFGLILMKPFRVKL